MSQLPQGVDQPTTQVSRARPARRSSRCVPWAIVLLSTGLGLVRCGTASTSEPTPDAGDACALCDLPSGLDGGLDGSVLTPTLQVRELGSGVDVLPSMSPDGSVLLVPTARRTERGRRPDRFADWQDRIRYEARGADGAVDIGEVCAWSHDPSRRRGVVMPLGQDAFAVARACVSTVPGRRASAKSGYDYSVIDAKSGGESPVALAAVPLGDVVKRWGESACARVRSGESVNLRCVGLAAPWSVTYEAADVASVGFAPGWLYFTKDSGAADNQRDWVFVSALGAVAHELRGDLAQASPAANGGLLVRLRDAGGGINTVWVLDGNGEPKELVTYRATVNGATLASSGRAAVTPDGDALVYARSSTSPGVPGRQEIVVRDLGSGEERTLAGDVREFRESWHLSDGSAADADAVMFISADSATSPGSLHVCALGTELCATWLGALDNPAGELPLAVARGPRLYLQRRFDDVARGAVYGATSSGPALPILGGDDSAAFGVNRAGTIAAITDRSAPRPGAGDLDPLQAQFYDLTSAPPAALTAFGSVAAPPMALGDCWVVVSPEVPTAGLDYIGGYQLSVACAAPSDGVER
jgi:hypothetical protein